MFSILQALLFILSIIVPSVAVQIRLIITFSFLFYVLYRFFRQKQASHYKYLVLGVLACFTGDLIFGNIISISASFLGGIAAFGIAQIFFICVFIKILKANKIKVLNPRLFISMSVLYIISLMLCFIFVKYSAPSIAITSAILAYSLLLCTMASFAISLTSINKRCWVIAAGAILFVVSDMIIGLTGLTSFRIDNREFFILLTYIPALMGMVYGISSNSVLPEKR
jgi:hypothetical protein